VIDTTRTVADYELRDYGIDHAQYFQGAGVAYTDWEDCFIGVGNNAEDAAEDAITAAYDNGWTFTTDPDLSEFKRTPDAHDECELVCDACLATDTPPVRCADCFALEDAHSECELQYHVVLYVK
jgi:hypothetical protein